MNTHPPPKEILFTVFAPPRPLNRSRWNYYQHQDGTIARSITHKQGGESSHTALDASDVFPNALEWARALHTREHEQFSGCPEANDLYATLCNVWMHTGRGKGENYWARGAQICLEGIIEDCQEWIRRLQTENS